MIEIPSDINGFVKSMTLSRADVMVNGAIAMSASYINTHQINNSVLVFLILNVRVIEWLKAKINK
jgi:hypothetical protein